MLVSMSLNAMTLASLLLCIPVHLHLKLLESLFDFPIQTLVLCFIKVKIHTVLLHHQLFI